MTEEEKLDQTIWRPDAESRSDHHADRADDFFPPHMVECAHGRQARAVARRDDVALLHEVGDGVGIPRHLGHGLGQCGDGGGRRSLGDIETEPVVRVEARDAGLRHRGQVGHGRHPVRRGDGQRAHLAGAHQRHGGGHAVEHEGHRARQQIADRQRTALVGHVDGLRADLLAQQLRLQVRQRAGALRSEVDVAVPGLDPAHELGDRPGRHVGIDDQHVRRVGDQADGNEIAREIGLGVGVEVAGDGLRGHGAQEEVVAVGGQARRDVHAQGAAGAGPVVDHHALRELVAQLLADQPRQDVGGAGGRIRDQHLQGTFRIALRRCAGARGCEAQGGEGGAERAEGIAARDGAGGDAGGVELGHAGNRWSQRGSTRKKHAARRVHPQPKPVINRFVFCHRCMECVPSLCTHDMAVLNRHQRLDLNQHLGG